MSPVFEVDLVSCDPVICLCSFASQNARRPSPFYLSSFLLPAVGSDTKVSPPAVALLAGCRMKAVGVNIHVRTWGWQDTNMPIRRWWSIHPLPVTRPVVVEDSSFVCLPAGRMEVTIFRTNQQDQRCSPCGNLINPWGDWFANPGPGAPFLRARAGFTWYDECDQGAKLQQWHIQKRVR